MALDQQQITSFADTMQINLHDTRLQAQTFQAGLSGLLTSVLLKVRKFANPANLIVEIRTVSGGEPTSTVLASEEIDVSSIPVNPSTTSTTINFSSPASVSSGTSYAIVLRQKDAGGDSSNFYIIAGDISNNYYANGLELYYISSWVSNALRDFYFQTFVTEPLSETDSFSLTDSVDIIENSHIVNLEDSLVLSDELQIGDIIGEDSVGLSDDISLSLSHIVSLEEIMELGDSGALGLSMENASSIIYHAPSTLYIITDTDPVNLIVVTIGSGDIPSFVGYTLNEVGETIKNAKDITINDTSEYAYIVGDDGQVMKVDITNISNRTQVDLNDTDNLLNVDTRNTFDLTYTGTLDSDGEVILLDERETKIINTDFRINRNLNYFISSTINYIKAKIINTKFNFLKVEQKSIKSDFRFTTASDPTNIEPIARTAWTITIDGVALTDVDLESISLVYNIDQYFTEASFSLARNHDSPNLTLAGVASQITNNNTVVIRISDLVVFDGETSKLQLLLGAKGQESLRVTCLSNAYTVKKQTPTGTIHASWQAIRNYYKKMDLIDTEVEIKDGEEGDKIEVRYSPGDEINTASLATKLTNARNTFKSNTINLPLARSTAQRHVYDVVLNNIDVDNSPIDPNSKTPNKYNGVKMDTGFEEFEWVHLTGTPPVNSLFRYLGNDGNDPFILGGELFGNTTAENLTLSDMINLGIFQPDPDYTYFWIVSAVKYITDAEGNTIKSIFTENYIGTSLDPLTSDNWILTDARFRKQRIDNNWILPSQGWEVTGEVSAQDQYSAVRNRPGSIGTRIPITHYYVGAEPYKDVSAEANGGYFPKVTFVDREDGLYAETREGYDYKSYAEQVANTEYEKLKNINGDLLPITSSTVEMTLDGYFYYSLGLLTKIQLVNTTEVGVFKDNSGFPLSIKSIELNSSSMKVTLTTDNQKTKLDLDLLDAELPNPDEFKSPSTSFRRQQKFNPATGTYVE